MIEVTVSGRGHLQRPETDVVQSLVVDTVSLISRLDQLMYRQSRVIRFHHCIGYLSKISDTLRKPEVISINRFIPISEKDGKNGDLN